MKAEQTKDFVKFMKNMMFFIVPAIAVFTALVQAGWIDVPARAAEVRELHDAVDENSDKIDAMQRILKSIEIDNAAAAEQRIAVQSQVQIMIDGNKELRTDIRELNTVLMGIFTNMNVNGSN